MKRIAIRLAHFIWNILLLEGVLLTLVALLWRWTGWHITATYDDALTTTGEVLAALGLLGLAGGKSSDDTSLAEGEIEIRSWHKDQRQFISPYDERNRTMGWLISLGIVTVGMGVVFNIFSP